MYSLAEQRPEEYNKQTMRATKKVNIGNIDRKMEMLESLLVSCLHNYHEPVKFMAQVDSLIQALRNFTFTIQANKSQIPHFDEWYADWQQRMKAEPFLKWIAETRTGVVHEDILTTKSNATLSLVTDHTQKITVKHYDIMATTEEIIANGVELANEEPAYRHSTGTIERHYLFEVNGEDESALSVLNTGFAFMRVLYSDLAALVGGEKTISGPLPPMKGKFAPPEDELNIAFKLRDGSVLNDHRVEVDREDMLKGQNLAKERYGSFKLKNKLDSTNAEEIVKGHFEIAKRIFEKDGHHISMMHLTGNRGRYMINPIFHDRAEKMYFMQQLAKIVREDDVTEIIATNESWILQDVKKVTKQILSGKEVSALRKKGEALEIIYLNKSGTIVSLQAPIIRNKEEGTVVLGEPHVRNIKPEHYPLFFPVFAEWGLIEKVVHNPKHGNETEQQEKPPTSE